MGIESSSACGCNCTSQVTNDTEHVSMCFTCRLHIFIGEGSVQIFCPLLYWVAATAKSLQSCPTLCDPIGSLIPGILQARTLEWGAISFSNAWKGKVKVKSLSHFRLLATPWTAAYQAPPPMGFSRQEYWSGVPLPSPLRFDVFSFCYRCGYKCFATDSCTRQHAGNLFWKRWWTEDHKNNYRYW